jgi:hypothetical protein
MIMASELRIGNWYSNGIGNYKLSTSDFMDYLNEAQVNNGAVENIFPIPITSEVLRKTEFELDEDESKHRCWHYRLGYNDWDQDFFLQLTPPDDEIDMCIIYSRDEPTSTCQIINFPKYLHQLQNLYYALTGKELFYAR